MPRIDDISYTLLRTYLPYLILKVLMVKGTVTAYTIIQTVNNAFGTQFSAGTVYSILYKLERRGYVDRKTGSPEVAITTQGKALMLKALRETEVLIPKIDDFLKG